MINFLARLDITMENGMLRIPSWRNDLECMADIAEEVVRIYGYNKIPTSIFKGPALPGHLSYEQKLREMINENLRALGCDEVLTYTFISPKYYDKILLSKDSPLRKSLTILNPLGEDTSIMRTTALPSLLEVVSRNYNNRNAYASLYEISTIFIPKLKDDGSVNAEVLPDEYRKIMLAQYGEGTDFYSLKGIIDQLLDRMNIHDVEFRPLSSNPSYHPGRCAEVYSKDTLIGILGEVHPKVRENYQIEVPAYAAELDFSAVESSIHEIERLYTPLPKFPAVTRDIAVICDRDLYVAELAKSIKRSAGNLLESLELFDVYTGKQVAEGKKSIAYSIILRAADHTLVDTEVEAVMAKIIKNLGNDTGATLRV
jgi:phenylalanyl-tRNA synthetase beta chain